MPSNIISVEIKWAVILFPGEKAISTPSVQTLSGVASDKSGY